MISNGTAVLGLGAIGPLAGKPVMEGKGVLFKKFSGIDVFDIEIEETDPDKLVEIVVRLEPTFGGINLEDIKAPECFHIEEKLRERMQISVFHDDQHGTAIVTAAAMINGLRWSTRSSRRSASSPRAPARPPSPAWTCWSAWGCVRTIFRLATARAWSIRDAGKTWEGKAGYAQDTGDRSLKDAVAGTDIFLGLSAPGCCPGHSQKHGRPAADPGPGQPQPGDPAGGRPGGAARLRHRHRAFGLPNQVNNVLCFPLIFRGALDVGATGINEEMKLAAVKAIADLALAGSSDIVVAAYGGKPLKFGPDYLIPKPFDPRLITQIAPAVAKAAMDSGVARRPIEDFDAYRMRLSQFVFQSGLVMKPLFERARQNPKRVVFAEGEQERVLRAVQVVVDDRLAKPILIGRRKVVQMRIKRLGLRLKAGEDFELADPEDDPRYREYWTLYHSLMERRGVTPDQARNIVHTRAAVIAALMVYRGEADAMICGIIGRSTGSSHTSKAFWDAAPACATWPP